MDVSDLRLFVNVVEAGSISRGATRSHLALGSASERIKEMERSLGTQLLVRERSGVKATDSGRALLHHAYPLLRGMQHLHADLADYGKRQNGYVKICSNSVALIEHLPGPLGAFLAAFPEANIRVEELLSREVVDRVLEGSADVGIISNPVDARSLEVLPFRRDRLVAITRRGAGFGRTRSLHFKDLLDHDIVGLGRGTGLQMMLEDYARGIGKPMRQRVQLRNFDATCSLVSQGAMVGIVPESVARRWQPGHNALHVMQLKDDWADLPVLICVRNSADLSLHARRLIELLTRDSGD